MTTFLTSPQIWATIAALAMLLGVIVAVIIALDVIDVATKAELDAIERNGEDVDSFDKHAEDAVRLIVEDRR